MIYDINYLMCFFFLQSRADVVVSATVTRCGRPTTTKEKRIPWITEPVKNFTFNGLMRKQNYVEKTVLFILNRLSSEWNCEKKQLMSTVDGMFGSIIFFSHFDRFEYNVLHRVLHNSLLKLLVCTLKRSFLLPICL